MTIGLFISEQNVKGKTRIIDAIFVFSLFLINIWLESKYPYHVLNKKIDCYNFLCEVIRTKKILDS